MLAPACWLNITRRIPQENSVMSGKQLFITPGQVVMVRHGSLRMVWRTYFVSCQSLKQKDGNWDRSVGEIISVCQELIPAQAPNEPSSQDWTQMFLYSTIRMLERVNKTRKSYAHVGGALRMLGLCQSDTTDPATPKYTICPCLHRVTHAEEQCSHCDVIGPLSPPAASPSDSKEW